VLPEIRFSWRRLLGATLPLGLAALLLLAMAADTLRSAREQADWQPLAARVEAAGARVRYRYRVTGQDYLTPPRALIYRPGDRLTVYVDPDRPSHSVVVPSRAGFGVYLLFGIGLWLTLLAMGLALSEDAHLLLHRDGWRALLDRLSGAEGRAVRNLRAVPDPRNPRSLSEALRGPLLRESQRLLWSSRGFLIPGYLADKTGMPAVLFVHVAAELGCRDRHTGC